VTNEDKARALRVLFAADTSAGSELARSLLHSLALPAGSAIRVVTALGPEPMHAGLSHDMLDDLVGGALASLREEVAKFAQPLAASGRRLETDALRGRPGGAILAEAERWHANLIVVGSNKKGAMAAALLGSVAAEVIDGTVLPVLVARTARVTSIVLAEDGSADARAAVDLVGSGLFAAPVHVVSAVHVMSHLAVGVAPTMRREAAEAHRELIAESRVEHERVAHAAAERLLASGARVTTAVREGDPAEVILALAEEEHADLIAMGTRGRTGLTRLLLGSVTRSVLNAAKSSILVTRAR
jgi:nucleotide-binding universal stress UspA family protein